METRIVKVRPGATTHPELASLGTLLADGQLVAFPTETVYGIAARKDSPEALELLRELKGCTADRPFTVHLADAGELLPQVAPPAPFVTRIIRRLWPGPLTLVLADRHGGQTGFRLPDCDIARALFRAAGVGLVATSANRSGKPPMVSPRQVQWHFKGKVAGILLSGRTRLAGPSTVAAIDGDRFALLRPGCVSPERIQEAGCYDVLFVCTGNLCRSPMAAAMLRKALADRLGVAEWGLRGAGVIVHSAGTSGIEGYPAPHDAVMAAALSGADLTQHYARPLTEEMIRHADVIYTAEEAHAQWIRQLDPAAADRIRPIGADGRDVPDPFSGPADGYGLVADRIENALEGMIERILRETGGNPRPE